MWLLIILKSSLGKLFLFSYVENNNELYKIKEKANQLLNSIQIYNQCTILLLSNLAYPQWISVECDHKAIGHVICATHLQKQNASTITISLGLSCPSSAMTKDGRCYKFVWFDGSVRIYTSVSQICISNQMNIKLISQVDSLKFLFETLDQENLVILSYYRLNSHKINVFSYNRIWLNNKYEKHSVHVNNALGYFICEGEIKNLTFSQMNCFLCQRKVFVSTLYLCDGRDDCSSAYNNQNATDEDYTECKQKNGHNEKIKLRKVSFCQPLLYLSKSGRCSMYTSQKFTLYQTDNKGTFKKKKVTSLKCNDSRVREPILLNDSVSRYPFADHPLVHEIMTKRNRDINCLSFGLLPCMYDNLKCFTITDICIYRLNHFNNLYPCKNGINIEHCKNFECHKHYKCPGYYCIPWGYVCDGKWDCPYGYDESHHQKCGISRQCTNMFKCRNSQLCVHVYDVCDGFMDCPIQDDEALCELKDIICPKLCTCLNFAVSCKININDTKVFPHLPHVSYHIVSTNIDSMLFLKDNTFLAVLNISQNLIADICNDVIKFYYLNNLDVSWNQIRKLSSGCFSELFNLQVIKIDNNQVTTMEEKSFYNLRHILLIDLSQNKLTSVLKYTFYNITRICKLNICNNPLKNIGHDIFSDMSLSSIVSDKFEICCLAPPMVFCPASKPWFTSCSTLLPNLPIKLTFVIIALCILMLNILSLCRNILILNTKQKGELFSILALSINCTDLQCGIYLAILCFANFYFGDDFIVRHNQWKSSITCYMAFLLLLLFSLLIPYFLSLLSIARFMVVKYPLHSKFKTASFVLKCIFWGSILITALVLSVIVIFVRKTVIPTNLCSPFIDPLDKIDEIKLITLFVALVQLFAFTFISSVYILLIKILKQNEGLFSMKSKKFDKNVLLQLILVTVSNLVGWFPSSVIFLSSLFLTKYPTDLLIWTTITVLPLNSLINPLLFIKFSVQNQSHVRKTSSERSRL